MDETYSSNVDNLNERLREYKQGEVDKASSLYNEAENKYGKMLNEYQDKWKAVQEGGQDEVTAQMGIKGVYNGAKKAFEVYKKYKGKKAGTDDKDEDDGDDADDGTEGGAEGDPQGAKLDEGNDPEPLTDEDRANIRDPLRQVREVRQNIQDRMNSRLKELDTSDIDDAQSGNPSGSAQGNEPDLGTDTGDDASDALTRAFQAPATEESAFGDLSGIPEEGTADSVMWKLNAQAATERGGNIGQGASSRGATDATDVTTADRPAGSTEGNPASGSATEGGNSAPAEQSGSSYDPEGAQGTPDSVPKPADAPSGGGAGGDANPLDADLPSSLTDATAPAAEGGGFLADLGVSEGVASAIPVVGEFLALFGGLFALGEGIAHLAHPPADKTKPAPVNTQLIPQSVQAKYANALPSFDSSSDNLSSDAVF